LLNNDPVQMQVSLMANALYLNEAERVLELAVKGSRAIERAMKQVERLNPKRERVKRISDFDVNSD